MLDEEFVERCFTSGGHGAEVEGIGGRVEVEVGPEGGASGEELMGSAELGRCVAVEKLSRPLPHQSCSP